MGIEVRFLTASELSLAAALERETFSSPWSENAMQEALRSGAWFIGAFCDGAFAGHMSVVSVLDEGQICNLAVVPAFRRLGVGTAMLFFLKDTARAGGLSLLMLEVRASNEAARSLYEKNGFAKVGTRPNYYAFPREDGVLYNCML